MKIVAVVPIKLINQRLPKKNIKSFTNGAPLCSYVLSTLLKIKEIDTIYVYCSDPEIQNYLPRGVKYLRRSELFDQDTTKMNDILKRFSEEISADIYVMTHVTAPFISKKSIEKGIKAILHDGYDSSFAAIRIQDFLWKDGRPFNYSLSDIPRTQDIPALYKETSGFYIYKREIMLQQNSRIGANPYIVEIGEIEGIDIDEEEDFIIADAVYNFVFKN